MKAESSRRQRLTPLTELKVPFGDLLLATVVGEEDGGLGTMPAAVAGARTHA
jgi:hypothetical protein